MRTSAISDYFILFQVRPPAAIWGAWNVVYVALHTRRYLPLGAHGALVPLFLAPLALLTARAFGFTEFASAATFPILMVGLPVAMILYYLVWKYAVGFLNVMLGIA